MEQGISQDGQHPSFAAFNQALDVYRQPNRAEMASADRNAIYAEHKETMITIAKDVALAYCCKVFAVPAEQRVWDRHWPSHGVDFNSCLSADFYSTTIRGRRMNGDVWLASGYQLAQCAINAIVRLIRWITTRMLMSMGHSQSLEKFIQNRSVV